MTNKERLINTCLCKPTDRPPFIALFGPWGETVERWHSEGLPKDKQWHEGLGFDPGIWGVNINFLFCPTFDYKLIEDHLVTQIWQDGTGAIIETSKRGPTIPRIIKPLISSMDDWIRVKKERLDPNDPKRFPENWNELIKVYNETEAMVQLGTYPCGLFGTLRAIMGVEELLVGFYDEPELVQTIMDDLTDFWLAIYEKACRDIKVDSIHIWEDMSGKQGSLISPDMMRQFMMPNYKRIKRFADDHDIKVITLDTDGRMDEMIPVFIESGINMLYPFEVAAGSDVLAFREQYPGLCIAGGIDKRALAEGRDAIDAELARIKPMYKKPGYIAWLDHLTHPEVSWDNFKYFCSELKKIIYSV
ncbi:MAG: hypothetical protein FWE82_04975 [Defluviitaleaceae bacterium]|nr:hypothetical protein [Defluviitaleaceae bacterium]